METAGARKRGRNEAFMKIKSGPLTAAIFRLEITEGTSERQRSKPVSHFDGYAEEAAELTAFSRRLFGWLAPDPGLHRFARWAGGARDGGAAAARGWGALKIYGLAVPTN